MGQNDSEKRTDFLPAESFSVGVQTEENALVDKGVLVLRPGALLVFRVRGAHDGLNLVAVDEASDVGVANLSGGEAEN